MPYVAAARGPSAHSCPEAELLAAFFEGVLPRERSEPIRSHIQQCRSCAQAGERLQAFETSEPTVAETEWKNVERRLDLWVESLLYNKATGARKEQKRRGAGIWEKLKAWVQVPEFRYAFAAVTAVIVVTSASLVIIHRGSYVAVTEPPPLRTAAPLPPALPTTAAEASPLAAPAEATEVEKRQTVSASKQRDAGTPSDATLAAHHVDRSQQPVVPLSKVQPGEQPGPAERRTWTVAPHSKPPAAATGLAKAQAATQLAKAQIRIPAATGILLRLDSVVGEPGAGSFRGHLVHALVRDGKEVLPGGTAVEGTALAEVADLRLKIRAIEVPGLTSEQGRKFVLTPDLTVPNAALGNQPDRQKFVPGMMVEVRFVSSVVFEEQALRPATSAVPK